MKIAAACLIPAVALALSLRATGQDEEKPKPVTQATALKLGEEKLTGFIGNGSEAGQDEAARLYAAARRIETESKLAQKDLRLVMQLDTLRAAIARWDDSWCQGISIMSGGGTMWAHMQSRNDSVLEDFLAAFSKRMPLKEGPPGADIQKQWETVKAKIESATVPEEAASVIENAPAVWKEQQAVMLKAWENVKWELEALSEADARAVLKHVMPDKEQLAGFGK